MRVPHERPIKESPTVLLLRRLAEVSSESVCLSKLDIDRKKADLG